MLSNFLQFGFNLLLLTVVAVGCLTALPVIGGWLRSKDCLSLDPFKARLASYIVVLAGVFLMGNLHVLDGWSRALSVLCFIGFGGLGVLRLWQWKIWEKWGWPDSCKEPPKPPSGDCGC